MWSQGKIEDIADTKTPNIIDDIDSEHSLSLESSLKAEMELQHGHIESFPSDNLLNFDSNMVH